MRHSEALGEIARRIASIPLPEETASAYGRLRALLDRIVALNLLYEARASRECEETVATLLPESGSDSERLSAALQSYLNHVRIKPQQSFLGEGNEINRVVLRPDEELVHVWNVAGFLTRLDADHPAAGDFIRQSGIAGLQPNDVAEWLDGAQRNPSRLNQLLQLHNAYRIDKPWNPIWSAKWSDAETIIRLQEPNTWLRAVGLPSTAEPQHLILFRYPASRAPALRRPTQFEAGWFAFHFPSPPCGEVSEGGFGLLMDQGSPTMRLVSEYIHPQIDWGEEDVFALQTTVDPSARDLQVLRIRHFVRLLARFEAALNPWMTDPNSLPDRAAGVG